jgi:hypothetical protein
MERDLNGRFVKGITPWNQNLTKENTPYLKNVSDSMKQNNPMKNPEIVKKAIKTNISRGIYIKTSERMKKENPIFKNKELAFKNGNNLWKSRKKTHFTLEERKKMSATRQNISLEDWEKFISREPYDQNWDNKFRNKIRKRDNQVCMNCGIHREKLKRALCVHHIDYNKELTIPENCISLCITCHILTNLNREYWKNLLQKKLSKSYHYEYDNKGNVVLNVCNNST